MNEKNFNENPPIVLNVEGHGTTDAMISLLGKIPPEVTAQIMAATDNPDERMALLSAEIAKLSEQPKGEAEATE